MQFERRRSARCIPAIGCLRILSNSFRIDRSSRRYPVFSFLSVAEPLHEEQSERTIT